MKLAGRLAAALFLVLLGGLAVLAARQVRHLAIRVDDLDLLPTRAEVLRSDRTIRETFGSELDERMLLAFTSRHRQATDPVFRADFHLFSGELAKERNLQLLLLDRLYRPRFRAADDPAEPWLLHPPDAAWIGRALDESVLAGRFAAGG